MGNVYSLKHNPIVAKIFFTMLAPTILMNLTTAIGSMADTVIIGNKLGEEALSVVTYATPIYMIINTLSALFAVGGCVAMGIDVGKGNKKEADKSFSIALELLAITGLLSVFTGAFFTGVVTNLLGATADVANLVYEYSQIILIGGPVFMLNIGMAFFVRNDGRATLSMVGMFLSIIVDIILNVVFVIIMDMGVAGAAYSTVIGQLVSVLVISSHFLTKKNTLKFRFAFNNTIFRIIKNGASSALQFVYQFLTILVLNHFVGKLAGNDGVVVYTVVFNLYTVSLSVFEGISQTIQPIVSVYFGENSTKKIKQSLKLAFLTTLVMCGSITILLELFPQSIPFVFGIDEQELITKSSVAVQIYATSMVIMTINVIICYYLQSIENGVTSAWLVSLRCCILFLAGVFVLGKAFGLNGVWASYTVSEVLGFVIYVCIALYKRNKLRKKGTEADVLFLDKAAERDIYCYTLNCKKGSFEDFESNVQSLLEQNPFVGNNVVLDVGEYLSQLKQLTAKKNGKYVEVEIVGSEKKVIIRDNLNHSDLKEKISVNNGSETEYGLVLGWNRFCLK